METVKQIQELTSVTTADNSDYLVLEQEEGTKKITKSNFLKEVNSSIDDLNTNLFYKSGDVISGYYNGAGFVTNSSQNVRFTISIARPISNVSSITGNVSLMVRQDGNYTHGSSANTYVTPSSISFISQIGGIFVDATMSDTTNAKNNSPAGIVAQCTLYLN